MIKHIINKLESLEKEIADAKGEFSVFGLFLREDAENRWDIVVAAPWLNSDSMEDLNYIVSKLNYYLKNNKQPSINSFRPIMKYPSSKTIKCVLLSF